jgi:CubicO group peptidase (beta-lactamase class C family)
MHRIWIVIAAMLLGVSAPAHAQEASPSFERAIPAIEQHFRQYQQDAHVPGLVWGIVQNGQIVHVGTSGVQDLNTRTQVNAETLFRIASMSKAFTALAILKLRDEGRLSLDALAETYVPELRDWRYPTTDSPRIRVRDLLSHVAGFVTDDPWGDRHQPMSEADFTALLREGMRFSHTPQTAYEYSNYGYALLGRIITNVSGRPYNEYIQAEIMRPLGMDSTSYEVRDTPTARRALGYRWENDAWALEPTMGHGVFGAMGGVQTSANDYAKWVAFLLDAWPARDGAELGPVRRSSVRELAQGLNFPRVAERQGLEGDPACRVAMAYGMGMTASQDCDLGFTLTHSGGYPGYGSNVLLLPEFGIGLFVFANRTYAGPGLTNRLAALELHRAGLLIARPAPVSDALAAAYQAAARMYGAGDLGPGLRMLAMNFLMDRTRRNWRREFARLKQQSGECATDAPITATGALHGRFTWACTRGAVEGEILLSPTNPPAIQALDLEAVSVQ